MKLNKKYFFAFERAKLYDNTIEAVVPHYQLMIDAVLSFIQATFPLESKLTIQDIGAGSGNDTIPILKLYPHAELTAWDLSENMEHEFIKNAQFNDIPEESYNFRVGDYLKQDTYSNNFDLIISAYCIHHYKLETKKLFFSKIFRELKYGGYFCLIDLSNFRSSNLSKFAHNHDLAFIAHNFDSNKLHSLRTLTDAKREQVKVEWLNHYKTDNILDTVEDQSNIMLDLGFSSVECIFKFFQHSVIIAKK